ncbi:hypothetical protein V6N11_048026 [Hibiscus sabdariffa]|uniref:Uncharacterized protein n=2 Tax=Hibiscus sabdariffa TaxID=183260 RepID=A0ABR2NXV3_9ROSI
MSLHLEEMNTSRFTFDIFHALGGNHLDFGFDFLAKFRVTTGVTIFPGDIPMAEASRGLSSFEKQSVPATVRTSSAPPSPIANNPTQDSVADISRHGR